MYPICGPMNILYSPESIVRDASIYDDPPYCSSAKTWFYRLTQRKYLKKLKPRFGFGIISVRC